MNYVDEYFPDDLSEANIERLNKLKLSAYLNVALVGLKVGKNKEVIKASTNALASEVIDDKQKAKALYRRGLGYSNAKDPNNALEDLSEAEKLNPGDAAISKAIQDVKKAEKLRKQKEKNAMAKFFS